MKGKNANSFRKILEIFCVFFNFLVIYLSIIYVQQVFKTSWLWIVLNATKVFILVKYLEEIQKNFKKPLVQRLFFIFSVVLAVALNILIIVNQWIPI